MEISNAIFTLRTYLSARAVPWWKSTMAGSCRREAGGRSSGAVREVHALGRGGGRQPARAPQQTVRYPMRPMRTRRERPTAAEAEPSLLKATPQGLCSAGGRDQKVGPAGEGRAACRLERQASVERKEIAETDRPAATVARQVGVARAQWTHWAEAAAT